MLPLWVVLEIPDSTAVLLCPGWMRSGLSTSDHGLRYPNTVMSCDENTFFTFESLVNFLILRWI